MKKIVTILILTGIISICAASEDQNNHPAHYDPEDLQQLKELEELKNLPIGNIGQEGLNLIDMSRRCGITKMIFVLEKASLSEELALEKRDVFISVSQKMRALLHANPEGNFINDDQLFNTYFMISRDFKRGRMSFDLKQEHILDLMAAFNLDAHKDYGPVREM